MGHGAGDVLLVEPLVKLDGGVEVVDKGVGILAEPPGPEFHSSVLSSRRRDEDPSPPRSCGRVVVLLIDFFRRRSGGMESVFGRGVYVAENTAQPASVEFVRFQRANYARSGLPPLVKVVLPL